MKKKLTFIFMLSLLCFLLEGTFIDDTAFMESYIEVDDSSSEDSTETWTEWLDTNKVTILVISGVVFLTIVGIYFFHPTVDVEPLIKIRTVAELEKYYATPLTVLDIDIIVKAFDLYGNLEVLLNLSENLKNSIINQNDCDKHIIEYLDIVIQRTFNTKTILFNLDEGFHLLQKLSEMKNIENRENIEEFLNLLKTIIEQIKKK